MRKMFLLAAALGAVASPALAAAPQSKAPAAAEKAPTAAELKDAQDALSLIVSALNSKDVPQDMKNGLFACIYENPLGKIGDAAAKVLAENKKLDPKDPTARLLVIAKICGAPLPKAAPPAAGGKAPAKGR